MAGLGVLGGPKVEEMERIYEEQFGVQQAKETVVPEVVETKNRIAEEIHHQRQLAEAMEQQQQQQKQHMMMQQMQQQSQDPFALANLTNSNVSPVPDIPMPQHMSMAERMFSNEEVPHEIRTKYWNVFNKDNVLTFLDEKRKRSKMINFDIMKIDMLNSTPYYEYTFDLEMELGIVRNAFETKLDRAMGFRGINIKNERTILQSQFTENRMIQEHENSQIKEGFMKRLFGRR